MKYCSKCGKQLTDEDIFCSGCGNKTEENKNVFSENKREKFLKATRKCPACGEILKLYDVRCPSCNSELSGIKHNVHFEDLIHQIDNLESEKKSKKKKDIELINNQIYNCIENYQVSNNKEELFEFILFAREKMNNNVWSESEELDEHYSNLRDVWKNKYKNLYQKAVFLYENDPEFLLIKEKKMEPKKKKILTIGILSGVVLTVVMVLSIIFGSINSYNNKVNDPNMTTVGYYSSELLEKHYTEVVSIFESRGFINIKTNALEDLITGWITKDGEVESVTINGDAEFNKREVFPKDAIVVITYHTFPSDDK